MFPITLKIPVALTGEFVNSRSHTTFPLWVLECCSNSAPQLPSNHTAKQNKQTKKDTLNFYYTCFHPNKRWMWCFDSRGINVSPKGALAKQPLTKTQSADQYCTHLPGCNYNSHQASHDKNCMRQAHGHIQGAFIVLGMKKRDRNMRMKFMACEKNDPSTPWRQKVWMCGIRGTTSQLNRNLFPILSWKA